MNNSIASRLQVRFADNTQPPIVLSRKLTVGFRQHESVPIDFPISTQQPGRTWFQRATAVDRVSTTKPSAHTRAIELIARHYETISNLSGAHFVLDGGRAWRDWLAGYVPSQAVCPRAANDEFLRDAGASHARAHPTDC